jgi:hypothetical protein
MFKSAGRSTETHDYVCDATLVSCILDDTTEPSNLDELLLDHSFGRRKWYRKKRSVWLTKIQYIFGQNMSR